MRSRAVCSIPLLLVPVLFVAACGDDDDAATGVPNPASVFCEAQGGTLEIHQDAAGNQAGICVLPDGTRIDEWEYYRANTSTTSTTPAVTSSPVTPAPTTEAPRPPTEVDAYATAFVEAWERGDRNAAAGLATDEALTSIFTRDGGGAGTWSLEMCEGTAGSSYCTFGAGGDARVIIRVANETATLGEPAGVIEVRFID